MAAVEARLGLVSARSLFSGDRGYVLCQCPRPLWRARHTGGLESSTHLYLLSLRKNIPQPLRRSSLYYTIFSVMFQYHSLTALVLARATQRVVLARATYSLVLARATHSLVLRDLVPLSACSSSEGHARATCCNGYHVCGPIAIRPC